MLPNQVASAETGGAYAYRDTSSYPSEAPLVLLQHFRGNLDNWDPAPIDAVAASRRVLTFDYGEVGGSSGVAADTIEGMARDAIAFSALALSRVDLLGFSIEERPGARARSHWALSGSTKPSPSR